MVKSNQLARMAYQIGGEYEYKEGASNYYLTYSMKKNRYYIDWSDYNKIPQVTYGSEETLQKMCEILNSK